MERRDRKEEMVSKKNKLGEVKMAKEVGGEPEETAHVKHEKRTGKGE